MISFIIGKPRQGKSFYSVKLLLDELKRVDGRPIVTNLKLRRAKVLEFLVNFCKMEPHEAVRRIEERLIELPPERTRAFFRVRGRGVWFSPEEDVTVPELTHKVPPYDSRPDKGVMYIIDEVHTIFNARNWKNSGDLVLWYNSQHGKLLDDCFFITQVPRFVEVQFRALSFEWHHIRNGYQQKLGPFSARSGFFRRAYYCEPNPTAQPYETERFAFHQAVAECYDTNAGVGVLGRGEPSLRQSKGLPFWTLPAGIVATVLICFLVMNFASKTGAKMIAKGALDAGKNAGNLAREVAGTSPQSVKPSGVSPDPQTLAQVMPTARPVEVAAARVPPWPVFLQGSVVVLSDGSRDHVSRHSVTARARGMAVVDGVRVPEA